MDLDEVARRMAALDAVYRPVATAPVDLAHLADLGTHIEAELAALGVAEQSEAVLRALLHHYEHGDEQVRASVRRLFDAHTSFRWAVHLPQNRTDEAGFRAQLIHISACDQDGDIRDVLLGLGDRCDRARAAGIDVDRVLVEVAAMSSDEDRYGMGSMRSILTRFVGSPGAA